MNELKVNLVLQTPDGIITFGCNNLPMLPLLQALLNSSNEEVCDAGCSFIDYVVRGTYE